MKKLFTAAAIAALIAIGLLFGQGPVQKVRLWDTNLSHSLLLKWNEDRAAGYTLNWIGITADRTITLQGNPTLDDWFDQSVKTTFAPTFAGLYLESSTTAPFLIMTNESNTERDPIIQFAVGATPVTKWTMGLDDSDVDKWKLTVGDEFGNHHDVIAISSGEGATPPVAEFTLIDSFAATSPKGICEDGDYLYYSDATASQQLVKVDISTGAEITRSPDAGQDLGNCVTDGTHVYAHSETEYLIRKYLCADLSYVSSSSTWTNLNATNGLVYFSGHLYLAHLQAFNIRKIRCSDMTTIWTTEFTQGSGTGQMNRPVGITTDGQYIYIQDYWPAGGNNRIIRLNMDGTWVDSVVVANTLDGGANGSIAMWCAGDYLYNTALYGAAYKIEKRNKSDLSISETFSVVPTKTMAGCQHSDYHYIINSGNQFIYKYQYVASDAAGESGIQFRLKDVYDQFNDIAKLTGSGRFGVGTTIPSEAIEAVGNIKATAGQFISTMATGTAPVVVSSTTVCTNLNAGLVDGFHHDQSLLTTAPPLFDHLHLSATSNQIVLQSAGVTGTITATPASSNKIWTLQDVTGTIYQTGGTDVAVADGGTNKSAWTLYAIPYASGVTTIDEIAIGTAGKVLAVNAGADGYTWASSLSNPMTDVGDMIIGGAAGAPAKLADVSVGSYLASGGVTTAPTWATLNQAAVAGLTTASGPTFEHLHLSKTTGEGLLTLLGTNDNTNTFFYVGQGLATGRSLGFGFQDNSDAVSGYGWFAVHGDAPGDSLVIRKGGNVGVGTTTPNVNEVYNRLTIAATDNVALTFGIENYGTGQTAFVLRRTGGTAARWYQYIPAASTDVRFSAGNASNDIIFSDGGNCSALSFTDRTPYPKDKKESYAAVLSLEGKDGKLDHSKLHPYVKAKDGRNLSALVSAQNEVIKDLLARIEALEKK